MGRRRTRDAVRAMNRASNQTSHVLPKLRSRVLGSTLNPELGGAIVRSDVFTVNTEAIAGDVLGVTTTGANEQLSVAGALQLRATCCEKPPNATTLTAKLAGFPAATAGVVVSELTWKETPVPVPDKEMIW